MKLLIKIIIIQIFLVSCANKKIKNPPFYSISYDGELKAYVLGTIHYGVSKDELPDLILNKLKNSNHLYLESFINKDQLPKNIFKLVNNAKLEKTLGVDNFNKLFSIYKELEKNNDLDNIESKKINLRDRLNSFTPLAAKILILEKEKKRIQDETIKLMMEDKELYEFAISIENNGQVGSYNSILDVQIQQIAEKQKSNIYNLDKKSLNICSDKLNSYANKNAIRFINNYFQSGNLELEEDLKNLARIVKSYKSTKLISFEQIDKSKFDKDSIEFKTNLCIFETRNKLWAERLSEDLSYPRKEPAFIAVGVGHLLNGKSYKSLFDILEKKGFTVDRVNQVD